MAREKRPAYRSPMAQSYAVIDPSINPEDIRDAIPERTAITTDWMGLHLQETKQRVESQRLDKGQNRALSNTTKKDTEFPSKDQKKAQKNEYSFSGVNSALLNRLMSSVPSAVTGASDKENDAPMFEPKHGKREATSRPRLATKIVTFSEVDGSSSSSSEDTNTEEPCTMGELVASFGVRKTRHASYRKSS